MSRNDLPAVFLEVVKIVNSDFTSIVGAQGWPNNNNRTVNLIFFVTWTKYFSLKYIENSFKNENYCLLTT